MPKGIGYGTSRTKVTKRKPNRSTDTTRLTTSNVGVRKKKKRKQTALVPRRGKPIRKKRRALVRR